MRDWLRRGGDVVLVGSKPTVAAADAERTSQPTNVRREMRVRMARSRRQCRRERTRRARFPSSYFSFISLTMMNASRRGFQSTFGLRP